jgi:hypothetical protein
MEYGTILNTDDNNSICSGKNYSYVFTRDNKDKINTNVKQNDRLLKYVGLETEDTVDAYIFSDKNINKMSTVITQLLAGVDKKNRPIIVPDKTITSVLSGVRSKFRPETGDMYSRYNFSSDRENDIDRIINEAINIIVTDIKDNADVLECNLKLNIWTTVLGDFNEHGLRSHSKIKLREKRPTPMLFNMNY